MLDWEIVKILYPNYRPGRRKLPGIRALQISFDTRLSALSFHHTIHGIWLRLEGAKTTVSADVVLHHTHDKIVQFSSVAQSCPTLFDPMNRSIPGFPVHHQLLEFIKLISIELVMPSSHLILSSPSPPAPNPSQHQSLFQ